MVGQDTSVQAVVLAGGLGTRLRPYTYLVPKPMLPVGSKPILEHILEWLKENGVVNVVVSTGYLGKVIQEYFGTGRDRGMRIAYAASPKPLGTAGQLKAAEGKIRGRFVCVYGDALLEMDLRHLVEFHAKHRAIATMALMKYEAEMKYGFMETDGEGRLTEWREKPMISGYINVGCIVMEKEFLRFIPPSQMYGMKETFEEAMKKGARLYGLRVEGRFIDIGDRKAYVEANETFVKRMGRVL
jgi:mannose-1-phosphate guanylyltransferase